MPFICDLRAWEAYMLAFFNIVFALREPRLPGFELQRLHFNKALLQLELFQQGAQL